MSAGSNLTLSEVLFEVYCVHVNSVELDAQIRNEAFSFLQQQVSLRGEILSWELLRTGFIFKGRNVPLVSMNGIFKPAILPEWPLTLRTAAPDGNNLRRYDDEIGSNGEIQYRYRGTDPNLGDNVRLRGALNAGVPLIYLFGVAAGRYRPVWPVYIVSDSPQSMSVTLMSDDPSAADFFDRTREHQIPDSVPRRRYVTTQVQRRLHQQLFREQVVRAYQVQCAICRLKHDELLEAAHILSDKDPDGVPEVSNGISLCAIHHTAYDRNIIGIRPDCVIQVRQDILKEIDGPMLKHGLQEFQNSKLTVPRVEKLRPNPSFLSRRYDAFVSARP